MACLGEQVDQPQDPKNAGSANALLVTALVVTAMLVGIPTAAAEDSTYKNVEGIQGGPGAEPQAVMSCVHTYTHWPFVEIHWSECL